MSILFTTLLILGIFLVSSNVIGWKTSLLIQIPVLGLAEATGIWLFYVQHQFERDIGIKSGGKW
jgi:omega-6 fatty acid desaturase (delta-12 desaturase)